MQTDKITITLDGLEGSSKADLERYKKTFEKGIWQIECELSDESIELTITRPLFAIFFKKGLHVIRNIRG